MSVPTLRLPFAATDKPAGVAVQVGGVAEVLVVTATCAGGAPLHPCKAFCSCPDTLRMSAFSAAVTDAVR